MTARDTEAGPIHAEPVQMKQAGRRLKESRRRLVSMSDLTSQKTRYPTNRPQPEPMPPPVATRQPTRSASAKCSARACAVICQSLTRSRLVTHGRLGCGRHAELRSSRSATSVSGLTVLQIAGRGVNILHRGSVRGGGKGRLKPIEEGNLRRLHPSACLIEIEPFDAIDLGECLHDP